MRTEIIIEAIVVGGEGGGHIDEAMIQYRKGFSGTVAATKGVIINGQLHSIISFPSQGGKQEGWRSCTASQ